MQQGKMTGATNCMLFADDIDLMGNSIEELDAYLDVQMQVIEDKGLIVSGKQSL